MSTSVCARPLRVQDGAAVGWERGVWGQPLVLESWALLVSRGGRGGFRTQRYPSWDEQWGAGVLERGSWRARDQAGLESSSGFWEECQGQERVGNDAQFSEEGSWSLLRLPEGSMAQPGVSTSGLEAPPLRPVLGLSLCGHRVSQSHGPPFTQVFVLLSDQPGGQIIKSDLGLQSCANCGISGAALAGGLTKGPPWPCHTTPPAPQPPSSAHKAEWW